MQMQPFPFDYFITRFAKDMKASEIWFCILKLLEKWKMTKVQMILRAHSHSKVKNRTVPWPISDQDAKGNEDIKMESANSLESKNLLK